MKVIITLEDTPTGVYPVISWDGNDVTDHLHHSLSMALATQFANMVKAQADIGTLKVTGPHEFN